MLDLSKLTPGPWFGDESYLVYGVDRSGDQMAKFDGPLNAPGDRNTNCAFAALARAAFDGDPAAVEWWEANRRRREEKPT